MQHTWGLIRRIAVPCLVVGLAAPLARAENWPQFLGPKRDAVAHDAKGLPDQWGEGVPRVVWSVPVGRGYGGAAIWGDSVLILDREAKRGDILRRLRLADGREVWRYRYDEPGEVQYDGSRSTPATDGEMVFSVGPFGRISAVTFDRGEKVWEAHLLRDWDATLPTWGVATSPLLMGNMVIISPWGSKASVVAYEKKTGRVLWQAKNPRNAVLDYQSPVPMTLDGKTMIVACGRQGDTIALDPENGEILWEYAGFPKQGWHIPSPTILDEGRILLVGGYRAGSVMIQVSKGDEGYVVRELWKNRNLPSRVAQPVVHQGFIYGLTTDTRGTLRCLTMDGQVKWDAWDAGLQLQELGNFILADGKIFLVDSNNGTLHMIRATPEGYQPLGSMQPLGGREVRGPLAYKDGKLVLRDLQKMVCLDLTGGR